MWALCMLRIRRSVTIVAWTTVLVVKEVEEEVWFQLDFEDKPDRVYWERGKVDTKNIKVLNIWPEPLEGWIIGRAEREADLGGGWKLGIQLWTCWVSVWDTQGEKWNRWLDTEDNKFREKSAVQNLGVISIDMPLRGLKFNGDTDLTVDN